MLGFNTCRKLGQAECVVVETEKELRERAGEALRAAARRAEAKELKFRAPSVTTGTPSSSQSEVGSNGEEEAGSLAGA